MTVRGLTVVAIDPLPLTIVEFPRAIQMMSRTALSCFPKLPATHWKHTGRHALKQRERLFLNITLAQISYRDARFTHWLYDGTVVSPLLPITRGGWGGGTWSENRCGCAAGH